MIDWNTLTIVLGICVSAIMIQYWLVGILDVLKSLRSEIISMNMKLIYIKDDINTIKNKKE